MKILLFGIPKPFEGHIGIIQQNALRSWRALGDQVDVLVLGDEKGCAEAAAEIGARHIPEIRRNEFGTPLLDDAFQKAQAIGSGNYLCYLNADIMLTDDFIRIFNRLENQLGNVLMVGRRWNVDITESIACHSSAAWQADFRQRVRRTGELYNGWNIDYFLFPKTLVEAMPAFAVGRPAWDNWMIYEARRRRISVVDATLGIMAIHQNHDYTHTKEGREGGKQALWFGVEAERNRALAQQQLYSIEDATHVLTRRGWILPNVTPRTWRRHLEVVQALYPEWHRRLGWWRQLVKGWLFLDHQFRLFLFRRGIDLFPYKDKRRRPAK